MSKDDLINSLISPVAKVWKAPSVRQLHPSFIIPDHLGTALLAQNPLVRQLRTDRLATVIKRYDV